jgi:hypothetical protein
MADFVEKVGIKEIIETAGYDFLDGVHGGAISDVWQEYLMFHPRRTCEAFAFATLQQDPWHELRYPKAKTLNELEAWIRPVIDEELTGKVSGEPHH